MFSVNWNWLNKYAYNYFGKLQNCQNFNKNANNDLIIHPTGHEIIFHLNFLMAHGIERLENSKLYTLYHCTVYCISEVMMYINIGILDCFHPDNELIVSVRVVNRFDKNRHTHTKKNQYLIHVFSLTKIVNCIFSICASLYFKIIQCGNINWTAT